MKEAAARAEAWLGDGRQGVVARVVRAEGLGPRGTSDVLFVDDHGSTEGTLLAGAIDREVVAGARQLLSRGDAASFVAADVDPDGASAAGLTCGGTVDVLVQRLGSVPVEWWRLIANGRAGALATVAGASPRCMVLHSGAAPAGTLGDDTIDEQVIAQASRLLRHPGATATTITVEGLEIAIETWNPLPTLVILGASDLAVALTRQAELLGWRAETFAAPDDAVDAVGALGEGDVLIVIEHDSAVANPVLAAALRAGLGYVGALGSRRTQVRRRETLAAAGIPADQLVHLHGPTGLDLGATTPQETAVSIVAEILAVRSGRSAQPLGATEGRITGPRPIESSSPPISSGDDSGRP